MIDTLKQYIGIQEWILSNRNVSSFFYILDNKITDYYSWIAPKGDELIIGSALQINTDHSLKFRILKKNIKNKLRIYGKKIKKETYIISKPMKKEDIVLGNKNVILVGEAGGWISPSTGEGISYALRTAKACAEALKENKENPVDSYKIKLRNLFLELGKKRAKAKILLDIEKRYEFLNKYVKDKE